MKPKRQPATPKPMPPLGPGIMGDVTFTGMDWEAVAVPKGWTLPGEASRPGMLKASPKAPKPRPEKEAGEPTDEAMAHGDYVLPETRGALAVYTNRKADRLGRLRNLKLITKAQQAGGYCFEKTYTSVNGSASSRDSTIAPIGGVAHETEDEAARFAAVRARLSAILTQVGPRAYSMLVSVCVFGDKLGKGLDRLMVLRAALDKCVEAYGVPK